MKFNWTNAHTGWDCLLFCLYVSRNSTSYSLEKLYFMLTTNNGTDILVYIYIVVLIYSGSDILTEFNFFNIMLYSGISHIVKECCAEEFWGECTWIVQKSAGKNC